MFHILNISEVSAKLSAGIAADLLANFLIGRKEMSRQPFTLFKRKGQGNYHVQYRDSEGNHLSMYSTGKSSKLEAAEIAFKWLREGRPVKRRDTSF